MNKYGARKTQVDGITFASRREANRWCELKLMEKAGLISDLQRQVQFEIVPKTDKYRARYYVADFVYIDAKTGDNVIEDAKGCRTQTYQLKKALMYWKYGVDITEV